MEKVIVNAGKGYDILIEKGILDSAGELISQVIKKGKALVVTDDNVDGFYGERVIKSLSDAGFEAMKFVFPHGEASKNHSTLLKIYDFMAMNGYTRSDFIVALGGGVVGDTAGYAAASYMRGVDFVQVPTTVLSQADSSVGGKTAVNINGGKNLVGAFHQPRLVICDTDTLNTLTPEFFADGMAEVVKHGMIKSAELFDILSTKDIKENIVDIMKRNVTIKGRVVENDEREKDERMLLNFGHTLAHALEKYYNFTGLSHGCAVAVGMSTFTHIAERRGMCKSGVADKLDALLEKCGLPLTDAAPPHELYTLSLRDKKHLADGMNIVVCSDIGQSKVVKMSVEEYAEFLKS
ncbi:MAG: 3-dehydroquinate synthase [Lachnospiraceae bacterium]|nr:3-dehydroquinate synthase [Ruminococcus sp.]MCM1275628.1 3-dehydroquinate synthase [Lachnospiraceae bacterium]